MFVRLFGFHYPGENHLIWRTRNMVRGQLARLGFKTLRASPEASDSL